MKKLAAPGRKGSVKKTSIETEDLVDEVSSSSSSTTAATATVTATAATTTIAAVFTPPPVDEVKEPTSVETPAVKQTVWRRESDGNDTWYVNVKTGESDWVIPPGGILYMPSVPTTTSTSIEVEVEVNAKAATATAAKAREAQAREEEVDREAAAEAEQMAAARQQKQKQQDEDARRRALAEEADRQRIEDEDRVREEELEAEKLRLENLRKVDEAKLRREREEASEQFTQERLQKEEETKRAMAAKSTEESAQLAERRRLLEEKKAKKAMFLNSVDNFQSDYQEKVAEEAQRRTDSAQAEPDKITEKMKSMSQNFKSDAAAGYVEVQPGQIPAPARTAPAPVRQEPTPKEVVSSKSVVAQEDKSSSIKLQASSNRSKYASDLFNSDSSDVFSFGSSSTSSSSSSSSTSSNFSSKPNVFDAGSEELATPMGIGAKARQKSEKSLNSDTSNSNSNSNSNSKSIFGSDIGSNSSSNNNNSKATVSAAPAAVPVPAPKAKASSGGGGESDNSRERRVNIEEYYDEGNDNIEEGAGADDDANLSNFLLGSERQELNENQKAAWRVLQADMKSKRKDFHGGVTYAFEGVFSWQMYGSTEAVDENGKPYTEYLMRCQWGPSFDTMQPWIVGRRYREFDQLDEELKEQFPDFAPRFKKLAEKSFFNYLDANVVAERRISMEEYVTHIVATMPTILRSGIMDEFMNISPRIRHIKGTMVKNGTWAVTLPQPGDTRAPQPVVGGIDLSQIQICSSDQAERVSKERNAAPLDEISLGMVEEDVRELWLILCRSGTREVGKRSRSRSLLLSLSNRWPSLRASMDFNNASVDLALVPRAMQVEEDFQRCFREFKVLAGAEAKELGGAAKK